MTLGSSINSPEKRLKIYRLEISYVHDVLRLHFYLYLNFCKRSVGQLVFFTQLRGISTSVTKMFSKKPTYFFCK